MTEESIEVIVIKTPNDNRRLRRMALNAQGLLNAAPFGRGLSGVKAAIKHLGYVQIDSISVIERAHHHVLFSRVPNYYPKMLDQLLVQGDVFEYWSHAAAYMPMSDFRYSLPYKHAIKSGQVHWYKTHDQKLMDELLVRIDQEGPLRAKDLESNTKRKQGGWWDWKPAKKALEQLYMQGDLMVKGRTGFQKTYDLAERVLPPDVNTEMPSTTEFAAHLLRQQLCCHGFVSLKGVTYLRRNTALKHAVNELVTSQLDSGLLEQIELPDGETYVMKTGHWDQAMHRINHRMGILSPFDNAVIQRDRLRSVFGFEYQIECYVPAAKRKFGYFSLPLLFRGEFIGRMDCKTHRKERQLEIKSLHYEPHDFDQTEVNEAFKVALKSFCQFQQCDSVSLNLI